MMQAADFQSLPIALASLQARPPGPPKLSVHLDTTPGRVIGEGWRIWFREASDALREQLTDVTRDERQRFDEAVGIVRDLVERTVSPDQPGLAIFCGGTPDDTLIVPLLRAPRDLVVWSPEPAVEPLVEAVDDAERVAVVLFDKERTRLFTIFLGEIEERHVFVDDVPGKQATGDWFGLSQARYARHHEDHVLRHVKRTTRALMDELRALPFDRLIVGGSPEATSMLLHHLPRPLRDRLAGTISVELFAPDSEVLTAALAAGEAAERRYELEQLRALLEASSAQGAVVGLDATLGVLNERRVHRLFVAAALDAPGVECERCQRLMLQAETCPVCRGPVTQVPSISERATACARAHDARVEHVAGEAGDVLMEHGGLAAWTRY
jgi:peptide chain release factor subunit 1